MTLELAISMSFVALVAVAAVFGSDIVSAVKGQRSGNGSAYSKEQIAETEERKSAWQEEFEARNPDGPPISQEEHDAFETWLNAQVRPAIRLAPVSGTNADSDGSRLGGPVALAKGQEWPLSEGGKPMEFLAQLDSSELPHLDGFPSEGVLQFFIPQDDDLMGMDTEDASNSDIAVLYRPNGAGGALSPTPLVPPMESVSPFQNREIQSNGLSLLGEAYSDPINNNTWEVDAKLGGNIRRPGFDRWEALFETRAANKPLIHHLGGYPVFVQWDFRKPGELDEYDTVLLRLTSDEHLMWGDVGEANFLIRSDDLVKRNFSRVIFWWDCS